MATATATTRLTQPVEPGGRTLVRSLLITGTFIVPALAVRFTGLHPNPVVSLLVYGAAVVAASFVLAWAAEAAQIDVSGGLAIAVLALIAVLPEYAVDLYYAYTAGHAQEYTQYAAANMTGSNRLLMGLGWPLVVLVGFAATRKLGDRRFSALPLEPSNRVELGFLLVAGVIAFVVPASGQIHVVLGAALLAWFGFYLYKLTRGDVRAKPHRSRRPAGHRPVPARAVAGTACVGGARVHHRDPVRRPRQGHRRDCHADLVKGQPVDAADGLTAGGAHDRRRRHGVAPGRPSGRGSAADRDPDADGHRADPVLAVQPRRGVGAARALRRPVPGYVDRRATDPVRRLRGAGRRRHDHQPPLPDRDADGPVRRPSETPRRSPARGPQRANISARLTSWIAFVTWIPRGQASVQLNVVRHRHTPSASLRMSSRSAAPSSRLSKMKRCALTIDAGPK